MSSSDRRPYLTATALNQALLNACHDNLECRIEMICEIETPTGRIYASDRNKYVGNTFYEALLVFPTISRTVGEWLSNELTFSTLTIELSNVDERFNNLLPGGADYGSWVGREVVVKVGLAEQASTYTTIFKGNVTPVGGFRRTVKSIVVIARDNFDKINAKFPNTVITYASYPRCEQKNLGKIVPYIYGDFTTELDPFPAAIPAYGVNGSDPFVNWKDKAVEISGANLTATAHGLDDDDKIQLGTNGTLPAPFVIDVNYYVINATPDTFQLSATMGGGAIVSGGPQSGSHSFIPNKPKSVTIAGATLTSNSHALDNNDIVQLATDGALPSGFVVGVSYYVVNATLNTFELSATMGGAAITSVDPQTGSHTFLPNPRASRRQLELLVSENDNTFFDQDGVYLKRGEIFSPVPSSELVGPGGSNNYFEIKQGGLWVDNGTGGSLAYIFEESDEFYCKVRGKDLSGYDDNIVSQAKDLLKTFGGLVDGDFDANWATYRDKATPAQSAISTIKSRIWAAEQTPVLAYVLSLFEQVRLEAFIDRNLKLKINALHFEDWDDTPDYTVKNWDIEKESLKTSIDDRNNFNRAQGAFSFLPVVNENVRATALFKNDASITQLGQTIGKKIVFPNLYIESQVELQIIEFLRLASAIVEIFDFNLTWRALLLDVGNFVKMNINIAAIQLDSVPAMIRDIGYNPEGLKLPTKVWCFQMVPFKTWNPGFAGITGGQSATITKE
jgi:hypothetical protein